MNKNIRITSSFSSSERDSIKKAVTEKIEKLIDQKIRKSDVI